MELLWRTNEATYVKHMAGADIYGSWKWESNKRRGIPPPIDHPLVHTPLAVFCIVRGLMDTYVGIPHSKAHPASPHNQQHGHAQEGGTLEQVHSSPRCTFGAIWAGDSFIPGSWDMEWGGGADSGWTCPWAPMSISSHGDAMHVTRAKAPITQIYGQCWCF